MTNAKTKTTTKTAEITPTDETKQTQTKSKAEPAASFAELLQFATPLDLACLALAAPLAALTGFLQVSFLFIFGPLLDQIGASTASGAFRPEPWGFVPGWTWPIWAWFLFFGALQWVTCFLYNGLTDYAKERMLLQYKTQYLKAIIRQDIGWYDTSNPQELSTRIGEGLAHVEGAMSSKTMILFEWLGMGFTGIAMTFIYEWRVALIALACSPLIVAAGALMSWAQQNGQKVVQDAYAEAGGQASEVLAAARTVASFGLEGAMCARYDKSLKRAERAGVKVAILVGVGMAMLFSAPNVMMGAGFVYGTTLMAGARRDSAVPHTFGVRLEDGRERNLSVCVNNCNVFDVSTVNTTATEALVNSNGDLTCEDLGQQTFVWSCYTAEFVGASNLINDAGWSDLSFGVGVSGPLQNATLLGVDGNALNADSFKTWFERQSGSSWVCWIGPASILLVIFALQNGSQGLGNVGGPVNNLGKGRRACAPIIRTINRVPAIDSFATDGRTLAQVRGEVAVRNLVFAYPAAPDHNVCDGYSLDIAAGQLVALCGPSGSGKSTLVQLLERFYDPASGSITLDGVDLRDFNLKWLRSQIGLVGQEPVLFTGTVGENIGYGKEDATQEEIEAAAKAANAHSFITEFLPQGYDTQVGQGGGKLSGGQKQRVAIARALIKQPSLLLLDEATSALDTAGERVVQAALDEIMSREKRTTIAIAHRLSTIKHADKIIVFESGKVAQEGSYDQLLKDKAGLFAGLARAQEEREARKPYFGGADHSGSMDEDDVPVQAEAVASFEEDDDDSTGEADGRTGSGTPRRKRKGKKGKKAKKEAPPKPPKGAIKRLFGMQDKGDSWLFLWGALGMFCASAAWPWMGILFAKLMTVPYLSNPDDLEQQGVWPWGVLFFVSFPVLTLAGFFEFYGFGAAGEHLTRNLRSRSMRHWLGMEMGFFDEETNSAGELTQFLGEKVTLIQSMNGEKLASAGRLVATLGWGLALMFIFGDWATCLVVLAALPLMGFAMSLQILLFAGGDIQDQQEASGKDTGSKRSAKSAGALVGEVVLGIRTVASFTAEHRFYQDYVTVVTAASKRTLKKAWYAGFINGASKGIVTMLFGAMFEFGMWRIEQTADDTAFVPSGGGQCPAPLSFGPAEKLFVPLMVMFMIAANLGGAASMAKDAKAAAAAAAAFFQRIDRKSLLDASSAGGTVPERAAQGAIEVREVVFAYPTRPEFQICQGYSLSIGAGQAVALCGPSGSGKSTLIQLLERFYDPISGSISLDGVDLRQLNLRWLRSQIGLVGQEPVLFAGTVAENIGYGKGGATQEEIEKAAKAANAHSFITDNLQDGYESEVGVRGGRLSGGQKQRIAIARALVREPSILLFDEATSALDNESERIVQAALDDIMSTTKRTTITVAHRLTTILNSDKIVVVNRGKVVEEGTHKELVSKKGTYATLWAAQQ